jgi:hypothetical protein
MDRVVNFLNSHQHKVLFLFNDDARRVRYLAVLSRRRGNIFLLELGHGGVALDPPTGSSHSKESSLVLAETSTYGMTAVDPSVIPLHVKQKIEKVSAVCMPRMSTLVSDSFTQVQQGMFLHPYFIVTTTSGKMDSHGKGCWRMGDFQWSLDTMGSLLILRLEDFYENQHTIHEKVAKLQENYWRFVISSVEEFIPKVRGRWKMPNEMRLFGTILERAKTLVEHRKNIEKISVQLISLYGVLHDVSLEALNIEEQIASVDSIVFHQMLDYGQKKRRLHKTLDELRLLEKHVLEVLLSLWFRYENTAIDSMYIINQVWTHLMEVENITLDFIKGQMRMDMDAKNLLLGGGSNKIKK